MLGEFAPRQNVAGHEQFVYWIARYAAPRVIGRKDCLPEEALHGPHYHGHRGLGRHVARHALRLGNPRHWCALRWYRILKLRFAEDSHLIPVVVKLVPDQLIVAAVPRQTLDASGAMGWVQRCKINELHRHTRWGPAEQSGRPDYPGIARMYLPKRQSEVQAASHHQLVMRPSDSSSRPIHARASTGPRLRLALQHPDAVRACHVHLCR